MTDEVVAGLDGGFATERRLVGLQERPVDERDYEVQGRKLGCVQTATPVVRPGATPGPVLVRMDCAALEARRRQEDPTEGIAYPALRVGVIFLGM